MAFVSHPQLSSTALRPDFRTEGRNGGPEPKMEPGRSPACAKAAETWATSLHVTYSRYAFSWQGCATKVAPSFSPRSREIAVLRL